MQDRSESDKRTEQAEMFGNRLAKTARHRRKWAARNKISCYRLYDRDIPEVPLALDWFEGKLHVSHYLALEREQKPEWLAQMVGVASERLGLADADVFVKERRRQSGADQYEVLSSAGERVPVAEGGLRFLVNLRDYLDTGLFLDHRQTRARVASIAAGKRMLNLFSYTASFSVYAASAGALETTSVDMSKTYTAWAEQNFALNGLESPHHRLLAEDVFAFLSTHRDHGDLYDLVVVDPPIFSNSKRMYGSFDVQRDHVELLEKTRAFCRVGADVIFSSSRKKFRIDATAVESVGFELTEITDQTVPEDFRQRRPHRCYALRAVS